MPDLFVSEIFYSIQGEGTLAGLPSVFIRTSGCNLRCRWCDTKYASWQPEGERMEVGEIVEAASVFGSRHAVLTGGEPMVAPALPALAAALRERGFHITIETAGTLPPEGIACDLASLSPKLSNATPLPGEIDAAWIARHERDRLCPETLAAWIAAYPYQLKFVVASPEDLGEIDALLAGVSRRAGPIPPGSVFLMPEGTDAATLAAREPWLIECCKRRGNRFCPRLHIALFGNRRGT